MRRHLYQKDKSMVVGCTCCITVFESQACSLEQSPERGCYLNLSELGGSEADVKLLVLQRGVGTQCERLSSWFRVKLIARYMAQAGY